MLECLTIQLSLKISRRITGVDRILSIGLMCRLSQTHSSVSRLFQLGTASFIFAIVEIEPRLSTSAKQGFYRWAASTSHYFAVKGSCYTFRVFVIMEKNSHMKWSSFYPTENFSFFCSSFPAHVNSFHNPISNILVHLSPLSAPPIIHSLLA